MDIRTLGELFFRAVELHDKPDAFVVRKEGAWRPVSHRDVLKAVEETSLGLSDAGVAPGDRVAILSENRFEWAAADYAILTAGAVNVPIYPTLPSNQVEYILKNSEAGLLFVSTPDLLTRAVEIRHRLGLSLKIVAFDSPPAPVKDVQTLDDLRSAGRAAAVHEPHRHRAAADRVHGDDLASIIYTSGTTGAPKGVMLTHANIVSNVLSALDALPIGNTDSCLSFLPLCHIFERMAGHFTMFHAGASIAYAESVETVPQNLAEVRPTILLSVPRLYEKMQARVLDTVEASPPVRQALFRWAVNVGRAVGEHRLAGVEPDGWLNFRYGIASRLVFSKLRDRLGGRIRFMVSGGAPLNATIGRFFHGAGLPILEGYGLTETSPVISCNRLDALRFGTVGHPIPGVEVRIAEDGEIMVKSPGVMKGYFKLPDATEEVLSGGWFHTGDIGHLDEDGFLVITDRKKDLIVTAGGKNVAPQPIENRLKSNPYITEAVLFGDKRPFVVALVVPDFEKMQVWAANNGVDGAGRDVLKDPKVSAFLMEQVAGCCDGLASYEQIRRIGIIDRELTVDGGDLTPTMKIKRRVVSREYGELIDSLYEDHPT